MSGSVFYTPIPTEALIPSNEEIAARLRTPVGFRDAQIHALEQELRRTIQAGMTAVRVPIRRLKGDALQLASACIQSAALKKNLEGCNDAYLMAVTLGMQTERFLHRLAILSPAKHFTADALASAYAEAAADFANGILFKEKRLTKRFSPGYGDLPLSIQPQLISLTEANKYLHISLNESLLMIPQKSITAILGIYEQEDQGETI